jgi:hypothetical protein
VSQYLTYNHVCLESEEWLVAALAALGYTEVERGRDLTLIGYDGKPRLDEQGAVMTADLVVRRRHVGHQSNDIGFKRTDGGFVPVVSDYDHRHHLPRVHGGAGEFERKLRVGYGNARAAAAAAHLQRRHRAVVQRQEQGRTVKIAVRW